MGCDLSKEWLTTAVSQASHTLTSCISLFRRKILFQRTCKETRRDELWIQCCNKTNDMELDLQITELTHCHSEDSSANVERHLRRLQTMSVPKRVDADATGAQHTLLFKQLVD